MSFIRKTVIDGKTLYLLTDNKASIPSFQIKSSSWGKIAVETNSLKTALSKLSFDQEEEVEKPKPEESKKAEWVSELDKLATEIQEEGSKEIAAAIDQISDIIEGK